MAELSLSTTHADTRAAVQALRALADDYLRQSLRFRDMANNLERCRPTEGGRKRRRGARPVHEVQPAIGYSANIVPVTGGAA